ncbi:MAG: gamma-glutamyltransferase [Phycisphaerales bacterium]|nr:gamma-glutamyltransferase [Phycisphaerales bacterium]
MIARTRLLWAPALAGIGVVLGLLSGGCARDMTHLNVTPAQPKHAASFSNGAVAADHRAASEAGAEMLRQGGNAVDAAVAASFCLSVVRPHSCGIGGGGFMVIFVPADERGVERRVVINYREVAPGAVGPEYYTGLDVADGSTFGVHASGVPGTVAGLLHALEHFGTMDRREVLAPAIRAAEEGFIADANHIEAMENIRGKIEDDPARLAMLGDLWERLYKSGEMRIGDRVQNPEQARALRLIAERGAGAFYRGDIADAIVGVMEEGGGPITREDLASYRVRRGEPLRGSFMGHELLTMPPPSSGGIAMIQIFGILERTLDGVELPARGSPLYTHLLTEAMKHAFADRAEWLADDAFVEVPVARLTSPAYIAELASRVDPERTLDDLFAYGSVTPENAQENAGGGTSHLSVVDSSGMAVACTETINLIGGSLVAVPGFGFLMNNEMDDFTTVPGAPNAFGLRQSDRNLPEPGKRPLSSMSPTIVLMDGRVVMVAGASGGPRIISGTSQVVLNALLFGMRAQRGVEAPRVHHQWTPDRLQFEPGSETRALRRAMRGFGHSTDETGTVGVVQAIYVDKHGWKHAASDPRKGGRPAGH